METKKITSTELTCCQERENAYLASVNRYKALLQEYREAKRLANSLPLLKRKIDKAQKGLDLAEKAMKADKERLKGRKFCEFVLNASYFYFGVPTYVKRRLETATKRWQSINRRKKDKPTVNV